MNTSVAAASLLLGLSLTLALPLGPAAAAGESDRVTAAAHTQGRSASDPDGLSNGGADKPGHTGGYTSDRDGNNGCGNDDDREDDNNGWCGRRTMRAKPVKAVTPEAPAPVTPAASSAGTSVAAMVLAGAESAAAGAESAGTSDPLTAVSDPAAATLVSDPAPPLSDPSAAEVMGAQEEREAAGGPASLPRTGAGLLALAAAGTALAGAGATLHRFSRRG
jgi:hypothetical protein